MREHTIFPTDIGIVDEEEYFILSLLLTKHSLTRTQIFQCNNKLDDPWKWEDELEEGRLETIINHLIRLSWIIEKDGILTLNKYHPKYLSSLLKEGKTYYCANCYTNEYTLSESDGEGRCSRCDSRDDHIDEKDVLRDVVETLRAYLNLAKQLGIPEEDYR